MSTRLVKRPARIAPPEVDSGEITIADPPKPQQTPPAAMSASMIIMPVMAGSGGLLMAITNSNPLMAATGGLFLIAAVSVGVVMLIGQRSGPRRQLRESRERYLDYLEELRRRLRRTVASQQANAAWRHPEPARLLDLARTDARRWERRVDDDDFLVLRVGLGDQPVATPLTMNTDTGPLNEFDPVCLETARTLQARYTTVREQPICVDLTEIGVLSVVGDRAAGRALARALVSQLVTFHAPQEVQLGVVRAAQHSEEWEWVKWLPHHLHPHLRDGDLPARLVSTSVSGMAELLAADLEARQDTYQRRRGQQMRPREHLVIVVDGEHLPGVWGLSAPEPGISLADLGVHVILLLGRRPDHRHRRGAGHRTPRVERHRLPDRPRTPRHPHRPGADPGAAADGRGGRGRGGLVRHDRSTGHPRGSGCGHIGPQADVAAAPAPGTTAGTDRDRGQRPRGDAGPQGVRARRHGAAWTRRRGDRFR